MQLNKVLKGLLIALPVLAVTACGSSDDAIDASAQQTTNQQQAPATDKQTTDTTTVASPLDSKAQLSEKEMKELKLRESQTVFFAFDDATVMGNYEEMLAAHAAYLSKDSALTVKVEGHADERGTPEYNIALGERRAEAVSKYLQALGVQADQIKIMSWGEEKPLVLGQSEDAYAKNRRAVIVY